jgi:hypothetical protein
VRQLWRVLLLTIPLKLINQIHREKETFRNRCRELVKLWGGNYHMISKQTFSYCSDSRSTARILHRLWRLGRATAQAVSLRLPTAAARVWSQVRTCGICGGHSGAGAGFLRVLRFSLQILIPPTAPYSSIIQDWYNRPISGRRTKWTQSHPQKIKKIN